MSAWSPLHSLSSLNFQLKIALLLFPLNGSNYFLSSIQTLVCVGYIIHLVGHVIALHALTILSWAKSMYSPPLNDELWWKKTLFDTHLIYIHCWILSSFFLLLFFFHLKFWCLSNGSSDGQWDWILVHSLCKYEAFHLPILMVVCPTPKWATFNCSRFDLTTQLSGGYYSKFTTAGLNVPSTDKWSLSLIGLLDQPPHFDLTYLTGY